MHYIFYYPDEMRAKSLSCYGNEVVKTPNFDRLAREGVLFENNYTQHPVCLASRCALMTGWYPHVQGFRTLQYYMQPWHPNFLRYIKEAGYQIHLYGKNHVFCDDVWKELIEFESDVDPHSGIQNDKKNAGMRFACDDYTMLDDPYPDDALEYIPDTIHINNAVQAIREYKEGDKPLFIFLPTFYPHAPYRITEQYHNMYDPADTPVLPPDLQGKPEFQALIRKYRELGDTDEQVFRKIHAVYLGMCSYCDMLLGRVLDALDETGLASDTTVVVSSDHGDWAGDYGLVEKWPSGMDDDLTKVPLLIRSPGCKAGHRVSELTETFDIFPTICDLEGIEIRHDQFGHSLKDQLNGAPGDPERVVYCEGGYDTREPHAFEGTNKFNMFMKEKTIYYPKMQQQIHSPESVARCVMSRDSRYKLTVRSSGENELYDMQTDPDELHNLYGNPDYQDLINKLQLRTLTWMVHTSDVVPWENHK
ncbi:sulfatase-like hydrolase/transferase [Ruminococcaceae bacterium OttesenSCG-928-L11]|nr:sulfatase-like hydrolase/transferase [Ruminococcaceae bacterium OttesenSCG-928-L11]